MQLHVGIAKPVPELRDLGFIRVVQVLARAKDLHGRNSSLLNLAEHRGGQAMVDKQMCRQYMIHQ
jgi:serine/threonine protein kinase HipA of HipAB toxin-antitoxin module